MLNPAPVRRHRARRVLTPGGVLDDGVVEVDASGVVQAVRRAHSGDPAAHDGWMVPGLINAHLHLEFASQGLVPGGEGFIPWVRRLMSDRAPVDEEMESAAARRMRDAGTVGVFDISNGGHTAPAFRQQGMQGVVQHELTGWSNKPDLAVRLQAASSDPSGEGVRTRPGPHAVYSVGPELLRATMAPRAGVPVSLHLGEDRGEVELVRHLDGPYAAWLRSLGIPDSDLAVFGHGHGLVAYLDGLGVLHDEVLLVHGVQLDREEHALLAARGVSLCLCPRSNLHILGELPDLDGLVATGVPLALGTDSLASSPDLDVLGEIEVLVGRAPHLDPLVWLRAATSGGSRALRRPDLGRFVEGARPGVLLLEGLDALSDLNERPPVRWLEAPRLPETS